MVLYEVNLVIDRDVFSEYCAWLKEHIKDMLQFEGFQHACLLKEVIVEDDTHQKLTVQYKVNTEDDLNHYFLKHASRMRKDGAERFGEKFSANRRIFVIDSQF